MHSPQRPARHANRYADRFGMVWSALCAVHCAAVPLLLALMPSLLLALHSHRDPRHELALFLHGLGRWEWLVAMIAGGIALFTTWHGWRLHARRAPLLLAVSGASLLTLATVYAPVAGNVWTHALASVSGGALLVTAHYRNLRLTASVAGA